MELEELKIKLQNFKDEQQQQKLRGLNSYNIMTVLRTFHAEVGMHSNFIYSLLNIEGDHYQGELFAKLFVEHVLKIDDFGGLKKVEAEELTNENRRIDFTIKSSNYYIGIEMKIDACDLNEQIAHYYDDLKKKAENDNDQEVIIYYLTKDGKGAKEKSSKEVEYKKISFEKEILNWLKECQKQVSDITNLNNAIGYYMDVVNMLVGKYTSPIKEYKELFLDRDIYECYEKNLSNIEGESLIKNGFKEVKQKLHNNFYSKLLAPILDNELEFKEYYENSESGRKTDGDIVIMELFKKYDLRIYIKQNKFASISIGLNNDFNFGDDSIRKSYLNRLLKIEQYKTDVKKGVRLESNISIPENTVNNLFMPQDDELEKLNPDIIEEVQEEHIKKIKEALKE